jgi:hypothetical protein
VYDVVGSSVEEDLAAAVDAAAPADFGGTAHVPYLIRDALKLEPVHLDTDDEDACRWLATMTYSPPSVATPQTGESVFTFDTGGGTEHITQSYSTVNRYPGTSADFEGAIGYTRDQLDGVDIITPIFNFTIRKYMPSATVTEAYWRTVMKLTGRVNAATFRGFEAGEVLFRGASGSQRNEDDWEITFNFSASENKTGLSVGSIFGIDKKGWEYLWVLYKTSADGAALKNVMVPESVYVERVYAYGDFADLQSDTE